MQNVQQRQLALLRHAVSFLDEHYQVLTPEIRAIVERLRTLVAAIEAAALDQASPELPAGPRLRRETNLLREQMLRVAASTKRHFRDEPAILVALKVPHKRAAVTNICVAARTMCDALAPHHDFLVAEQVDVRRIARLRERAEALAYLEQALDSATPKRRTATQRLPDLISDAMREMRAIGRLLPEIDGIRLAEWPGSVRLPKRQGRPPKKRARKPKPPTDADGTTDQPPSPS
jgi:hypothetical protein